MSWVSPSLLLWFVVLLVALEASLLWAMLHRGAGPVESPALLALRRLAQAPASRDLENGFQRAARELAAAFSCRYAVLSVYTDASHTFLRTLAFWDGEQFLPPIEYAVAGTPCEHCIRAGIEITERDVQRKYPRDRALSEIAVQSYLGAAMVAADGEVLGVISVLNGEPRGASEEDRLLLRLYARRFAAELLHERAESARCKLAQRHGAVLDSPLQGVVVHRAGRILFANGAAADMFGYDDGQALQSLADFLSLFPAAERPRLCRRWEAPEQGGPVELRGVRRDGSLIDLRCSLRQIPWDDAPANLSTLSDISRHRAVERALRHSEARFEDLIGIAADWFWEQDEALRFTYLSPGHERATGLPCSRFLGRTRWETFSGEIDDPAGWQQHVSDVKAQRPYVFEYRIKRPDGSTLYIYNAGVPVFDDAGAFRGYRGIGRDVTAQREGAQALRVRMATQAERLGEVEAELDRHRHELASYRRLALSGGLGVQRSLEVSSVLASLRERAGGLGDLVESVVARDALAALETGLKQVERLVGQPQALALGESPRIGCLELGAVIDELRDGLLLPESVSFSYVGERPYRIVADQARLLHALRIMIYQVSRTMQGRGFVQIEAQRLGRGDRIRIRNDGGAPVPQAPPGPIDVFAAAADSFQVGLWVVRELLHTFDGELLWESGEDGHGLVIQLPSLTNEQQKAG